MVLRLCIYPYQFASVYVTAVVFQSSIFDHLALLLPTALVQAASSEPTFYALESLQCHIV